MKCCARGRADGRSETSSDAGDASATMSGSERFDRADGGFASDEEEEEEEARWDEERAVWNRDGDGDGDAGEGERSRRRSAWDRAGDDASGDGGSASPTHSTFGRDSERRRRMRKTSKLVAERLGGAASDESDDDEFAGGLERARSAALDEEQGFGFVTRRDVERRREERARAKWEEEERQRREEAKEAKRAKRERRRAEKKRERELVEESETASLLDGTAKSRVRRFMGLKVSTVKYAAVAVSAVVACGVGAVLYSGASTKPGTMEIRGGENTLKTADPTLQPLKATTDRILKGMKERLTGKKSSDAKDAKRAGEDVDADKDSSKTKKSSSKGAKSKDDDDADDDAGEKKKKSAADDDGDEKEDDKADNVDDDDDDDAKSSRDKKKKSEKKSKREASLGVVPIVAEDDSIKASSSCAPVHVESRHGVFRQYNKACMGDEKRPLGCDDKSSEGCQSCFIDGSAAATQVKSYVRCSHHVCDAYDVRGCDPDPNERVVEEKSSSGKEKVRLGRPKRGPAADVARRHKMFANPASTRTADAEETEVCLPNLEDAKRGIFQYSERYCRALGHTDVDYSGCISVGKSSCRMCVTKSAQSSSAVFSVCPRSVCEHHDLLYQQCLEDAEDTDVDDDEN